MSPPCLVHWLYSPCPRANNKIHLITSLIWPKNSSSWVGLSWARDNFLGSGHGVQWVQCITVASFVYLTFSSVNRVFIGFPGLGSHFRLGEQKDTPGPLFQVFLTYSILVLRSQIRVWGRRRRESLLQKGSFSVAAALVCWVADHPHRRPRFGFSLSLSTRILQHGNLYFFFSFFISLLILFLFYFCL